MRKLLTLTEKKHERMGAISRETGIDSFSELIRYLVLFYEQNQKRTPGRPRMTDREDDANPREEDVDDIEKYKVPDKFTTSPYSYNDLKGWYDMHPEAGAMPVRADLVIHSRYKGTR